MQTKGDERKRRNTSNRIDAGVMLEVNEARGEPNRRGVLAP